MCYHVVTSVFRTAGTPNRGPAAPPSVMLMSSSLYNHLISRCSKAALTTLLHFPLSPTREIQVPRGMKCLNNRAESHLTGQVECELDTMANRAWVNQAYCGSPPPLPRAVSTIYNPQPLFQGSMDSMYKLPVDTPSTFPEEPEPVDQSLVKKRRGCCSFIKGRSPCFSVTVNVYQLYYL